MLKATDIKEALFSTAKNGYRKDEVDALLDKIVEDYRQFETLLATQQSRIATLENEVAEKDISLNSLNTVLISAQKLADSITSDAKKQAEETIEAANTEAENIKLRTKKALEEIDAVLTEQKSAAQAQVDSMLEEAARKSEGMILAAKDSVTREQLLFDKLKSEVAEFKRQIKDTYKEHIESLSKLPEEVTLNPELAASTIEDIINKEPDLLKFIEKTPITAQPEEEAQEQDTAEATTEEASTVDTGVEDISSTAESETTVLPDLSSAGFVIQAIDDEEEDAEVKDDDEKDKPTFSKGFFAKHK